MAGNILSANIRSNKPPIPPAPSQVVEIRTSEAAPCGETVNVVTALEPVSDSAGPGLVRAPRPHSRTRGCTCRPSP